jgi:predicted house-cleaning noncanonical NTP pyrophosphatase (MazG superfamily)
MSRILIEYNPPLTIVAQKLIRDNITESMRSNDETSAQYDIDMVAELLEEYDKHKDLELIDKLREEGVHYIEF